MITYVKGVWNGFSRYRYLLANLVQRDLKVKYRRSVLGILWSILNPLLMMTVMGVVFINFFKGGAMVLPLAANGKAPEYLVYLLSGQLVFGFFSEATKAAMDSILASSNLIKKVYVPKYIFPLEKTMFSFVNVMFSMIALLLVMLVTRSLFTPWALLFIPVLVLLLLFNYGVGLMLAAFTVFFRDIKHFYEIIVLALNYLTPIFYTESLFQGAGTLNHFMRIVFRVNPMYWYVGTFRQVVVYGLPPTLQQILMCMAFAVIALLLGSFIFKKSQDKFILYI